MHSDPRRLIEAVSEAAGRPLNLDVTDDRLLIQKGCYILNMWGFGPFYDYKLFIEGPFSTDLAEDYDIVGTPPYEQKTMDIPEDIIISLSRIIENGPRYLEAYTVMMTVYEINPNITDDDARKMALNVKPYLKNELSDASACLIPCITRCDSQVIFSHSPRNTCNMT